MLFFFCCGVALVAERACATSVINFTMALPVRLPVLSPSETTGEKLFGSWNGSGSGDSGTLLGLCGREVAATCATKMHDIM